MTGLDLRAEWLAALFGPFGGLRGPMDLGRLSFHVKRARISSVHCRCAERAMLLPLKGLPGGSHLRQGPPALRCGR